MDNREMYVWSECYRPPTVNDCVLPDDLKNTFLGFVQEKTIPNLLLSGGAGVGKSTVSRALVKDCEYDYLFINASLNGNIDTLRTSILQFASSASLTGSRKVVILDEADRLSALTQDALKGFIETFPCAFILTSNAKNKIIQPLHSRCNVIDFVFKREDKKSLCLLFLKRMEKILTEQNITYNKQVLANVIVNRYPDFRKTINHIQSYVMKNKTLDEGILTRELNTDIQSLLKAMKEKEYLAVRQWVVDNLDNDPIQLYRKIYDGLQTEMQINSVPGLVILTADYMFKNSFVADPEVCLLAYLTEIMGNVEWK